jgi:nucleotide-binding universal stress UspA family protein
MKKLSKVLVPVDGQPVDDEAIRLACQIAKQDKAHVLLLYVIEVQRNLPIDAENIPAQEHGEQVLSHAEQVAHSLHAQIETELLQSRVAGSAIVDEATDRHVDLIVIGVPYRKILGEFQINPTPNYVMKNAPCPVWLCREGAPQDSSNSDSRKK